jgi:hypothetical protein
MRLGQTLSIHVLKLEDSREITRVGTIEGPAAVTLAWLARNWSSLLLKTASSSIRVRKSAAAEISIPLQYSGDGRR